MINLQNLTITAQMPGHSDFAGDIFECPDFVAGIDQEIGLMAISTSKPGIEISPARLTMDILLDDMRINIPQFAEDITESKYSSLGVDCLQESLDNINEYLYNLVGSQFGSTGAVATQLSAFQYLNGYLSYVLGLGVKCLLLRNNDLMELSNETSHLVGALGETPQFESRVKQEQLNQGDILFVASSGDINTIEEDFIRVTLSRFPENLETALRQINTKVIRKGMKTIPGIILCRINHSSQTKRRWMDKLRNG